MPQGNVRYAHESQTGEAEWKRRGNLGARLTDQARVSRRLWRRHGQAMLCFQPALVIFLRWDACVWRDCFIVLALDLCAGNTQTADGYIIYHRPWSNLDMSLDNLALDVDVQ